VKEIWQPVEEAPGYYVSNHGNVRKALDYNMATGRLPDGTRTVSMTVDKKQQVFVLRRVVAAAFCDIPDEHSDTVVHLDGDQNNCHADNLVWRPRWFAWRYTRQFRLATLDRWEIPVVNVVTGDMSPSVVAAGMIDGTLWADVYRSVIEGVQIYPYGHIYSHAEDYHDTTKR